MSDEILTLNTNDISNCMNTIIHAIENNYELEAEAINKMPEPLATAFNSLLCRVRESFKAKEQELNALGSANVRMLLLTEAISDWKSVDFDLKKSGKNIDASLFMASLKDIMDATGALSSLIVLVDNEGNISSINDIAIDNVSHKDFYGKNINNIIDLINQQGPVLTIKDYDQYNDVYDFDLFSNYIKSALIIPVFSGKKIRGVIFMVNKYDNLEFNQNDFMIAEIFSKEISHFIERNELLTELQNEKSEQEALVNEIQRTQTQLLQSEKMASIGSLAAGVAHEINNPVGYISSNITSLKNYITDLFSIVEFFESYENDLPEEKQKLIQKKKSEIELDYIKSDIIELLSESEEGVKRVKRIVQDLKDFSHVDEAEWQWANIHSGIDSTLNIVHNETKYTTKIIKQYGDIPDIECIISQLNQVFMNLIVNAAHSIETKGTITIATDLVDNDHIIISFVDTGKGISEENLKRIFDPFFTTKPVGKGTGLGLPLSFGIIEKHNGKIEVTSEPGVGTRASIVLPVKQPAVKVEE